MAETELIGKVIAKDFKTVNWNDKRTGDQKSARAGKLVIEEDNSYVTKQGEQKNFFKTIPVDFFGTTAQNAETIEIGSEVSIHVQLGGSPWKDTHFAKIEGREIRVLSGTTSTGKEEVPF